MINAHLQSEQPATLCPQCGELLDGATSLDGMYRPEPGDITICLYCQTILEYGEGTSLKETDTAKLPAEVQKRIRGLQQTLRDYWKAKPRKTSQERKQ